MSACQAIEFRKPLKSSALLETAHSFVRQTVSFANEDRIFADDINQIKKIIADFSFVNHIGNSKTLNENYNEFEL
jgi:histidine ammonia-lyase